MDSIFTNELAQEKSPYLLQHASNPVDWLPWGTEAFEKARAEQKPIFLSIGYSTCHWCHVMAHESFENEATARILNEHFVSIKVDREERPDVDRVYMNFVQATTGAGGWPMSVFLTPELKPFAGGTYFPPEDRYGRVGFPNLLKRVAQAWQEQRQEILNHGEHLAEILRDQVANPQDQAHLPHHSVFQTALEQIQSSFDPRFGGFGSAPKFPRPVLLNLLFRTGDSRGLNMALFTLRQMARGGMHDHLGGGFHRYSVDRFWHVPHFEKMLYDQAQLAISYLEAFQITRDAFFAKVAADILEYVRRDMTDSGGAFYSAEDADSLSPYPEHPHSGEGLFYLWTKEEVDRALEPKEAEAFTLFYGIEAGGNSPEESDPQGEFTGKNILIQRFGIEELANQLKTSSQELFSLLSSARKKLAELRAKRPRPHLDDKIITAWNGLMISAFARAAEVLDEPSYLESAKRAADFIRNYLRMADGSLLRCWRKGPGKVPGFSDDYAFMIQACLDLYESSFEIQWLQLAQDLQETMNSLFGDPVHGGFFGILAEDTNIFMRLKEDHDGAEPSANSIAALNLLRLGQITGNERLRQFGRKAIAAFGHLLRQMPTAMPQMLVALQFESAHPKQILIASTATQARAITREIFARFIPNKVVLLADGGEGQQWLGKRLEFLRSIAPIDGKPTVYLCENFTCQLPVTEPGQLRELLDRAAGNEPH